MARSLPAPTGASSIEWLERSALDLPLPDADFDAVLCQQGLQFFPDKLVALREMRRVLDRRGRLALSVWTGIGPYHGALGAVLARFVGNAAAISFAPLGKCRPGMSSPPCNGRGLFRRGGSCQVGLIFTCPVWISSYWII